MTKERNTFEFPESFQVTSFIKNQKDFDVEELVKVIGNKMLGYNEATINILYNDRLLNRLSTNNCKLQAILYKTALDHTYNLFISTKHTDRIEYIICHEMAHFDQYERGDLQVMDNYQGFIWKGEEFESSTNYDGRPWEKEAVNRQHKIWKEFKNLYYK